MKNEFGGKESDTYPKSYRQVKVRGVNIHSNVEVIGELDK